MKDITSIPLSTEAYLKALELNLTTWTDYRTGHIFIQRWFWKNLSSEAKAIAIKEMEGLMNSYDCNRTG